MKNSILITNLESRIGKVVCQKISSKIYDITCFYPEGKTRKSFINTTSDVSLIPLTISNTLVLKKHLSLNDYDIVIHIPDFHNKLNRNRRDLRIANIYAMEQIIEYCINKNKKLIYCSSVAIYGNSPFELPSHDRTEKMAIGYRSRMIAEMESLIEKNRLKGLQAIILRPAPIYGKSCPGFFKSMQTLIKCRCLPLVNERIHIHLCNIDLLAEIIHQSIKNGLAVGRNYNVADFEPVILRNLINYLSCQINGHKYKTLFKLNLYFGRNIALICYKFRLVSIGNFLEKLTHNWYYDTAMLARDYNVPVIKTIPDQANTY